MKQIRPGVEPPQTKHVAVTRLQLKGVSGGRRGGRETSIGVGENFDLGICAIIEALVAVGRRAGTNLDERPRGRPRGRIPAIVGPVGILDEEILVVVDVPLLIGGVGIAKVQLYIRRRTASPASASVGVGLEPQQLPIEIPHLEIITVVAYFQTQLRPGTGAGDGDAVVGAGAGCEVDGIVLLLRALSVCRGGE